MMFVVMRDKTQMMKLPIFFLPVLGVAATIPADISGVRPGAVAVSAAAETLTVRWPDDTSRATST